MLSQKILLSMTWTINFQPLLCVHPSVWPHQTHEACSTRMGASLLRLHHNYTSQFSSN